MQTLLARLAFYTAMTIAAAASAQVVPVAPRIPSASFNVAPPPAGVDCTNALQHALDAARDAGGGRVVLPKGEYLSGPLVMGSNTELHLDEGAALRFTNDIANYPQRNRRYIDCLTATNAHDIAITGDGEIDGQGAPWWAIYRKLASGESASATRPDPASLPHRPYMIVFRHCQRVSVQGVTLTNSPSFHLVPDGCQDVLIDGIRIVAPANSPNTDGVDPSGLNFRFTHCMFDVGDDCIAIKPSTPSIAGHVSCEDFLIEDCTFKHGHGLSIGGQTPGGMKHLVVRNCTFDSTVAGIRMKAGRGAGGLVEDLTYEHLTMKDVKTPIQITSYYPTMPKQPETDPAQPVSAKTPIWRDIHISHLTATGAERAMQIIGLPEQAVIGVAMSDVKIAGKRGAQVIHARGVVLESSQIDASEGQALESADAQVSGVPTSSH